MQIQNNFSEENVNKNLYSINATILAVSQKATFGEHKTMIALNKASKIISIV